MRRSIIWLICMNFKWRVTARNIWCIISTSSTARVNIWCRNSHKISTQMLYTTETWGWTLLHVDESIFDVKWMALFRLDFKNIKVSLAPHKNGHLRHGPFLNDDQEPFRSGHLIEVGTIFWSENLIPAISLQPTRADPKINLRDNSQVTLILQLWWMIITHYRNAFSRK